MIIPIITRSTHDSGWKFQISEINFNKISAEPTGVFLALGGVDYPMTTLYAEQVANNEVLFGNYFKCEVINGLFYFVLKFAFQSVNNQSVPNAFFQTHDFNKILNDSLLTGAYTEYSSDFTTLPDAYMGKPAFTLDVHYITMETEIANSYFEAQINVRCFDFNNSSHKDYLIKNKLIPFKGIAKLNIGQTIHRLLDKFQDPNIENEYAPALVEISVKERTIIGDYLLRINEPISSVYFYGGISNYANKKLPLAFHQDQITRVTPNSKLFLNYIRNLKEGKIEISKNNELIDTINLDQDSKAVSHQINFEDFAPGDFVKYTISGNNHDGDVSVEKNYIVFPAEILSNTIVWEDHFLLNNAFEFTGEFSHASDIERITQKNFKHFTDVTNIVAVNEDKKFKINTGWIGATDANLINDLMKSKRVWLLPSDTNPNETIQLRPIDKQMVNYDSQRELYDYSIEFIINKQYNEEVYSF
jgi:hypothetical protein